MDRMADGPPDEGGAGIVPQFSPVSSNAVWSTPQVENLPNSSTLLYIAVEYVKPQGDFKLDAEATNLSPPPQDYNYEQHVSPLDPKMSSVARYSPVYTEPSTMFNNPVVVHQLVSNNAQQQEQFITGLPNPHSPSEVLPISLSNADLRQVIGNRFLQMLSEDEMSSSNGPPTDGLQLVPDSEQEVELLITDQATGISYSVSTQEYLVERCLEDDQQLLEALAPGPLLDTDLLALDENTLKAQLPDIGESLTVPTLTQIANPSVNMSLAPVKTEVPELSESRNDVAKRSKRQSECLEPEDILLSRLYSISDKPVLSRARATLPETHLVISKQGDGWGVFAKKLIPKRTLFGPLEGLLVENTSCLKSEEDQLKLLVEDENGVVKRMDISDENTSNWMSFVRKAKTYNEQNLVLNQHGTSLYYVTTKNILHKHELLVGYSNPYAQKYDLDVLKPQSSEANTWPCFECSQEFPSSEQLQKHLNLHDDVKNENIRPRKKNFRGKRKIFMRRFQKPDVLECSVCGDTFPYPKYHVLKKHLLEHGLEPNSIPDKFIVVKSWKCEECNVYFNSEMLLKIHNLQHNVDCFEEQTTHLCPACQHKFPTQRQLVSHVLQHAVKRKVPEQLKGFKCPSCYKIFATRERLQRHLLVHGSEESKPLQCSTCKKRFLNNSALACHLKTHYVGKKVFECPICKESFDHVLQLKSHVSEHCENGQYTCPHCNKVFKKYCIIRKHIRALHCERVHTCPDCSKCFATLDKLRMHLLRHSDHREFICADCGKQFKRKDKLKEHGKRMHSGESSPAKMVQNTKKFTPKVQPTDYHRFIYKCHACMVGFKRRGMLVNHLAKRHPDISPDSVPELNLPILRATRDYYCQYCDKVYKSSSKRKAHILKNHPGAALPLSNRRQGSYSEVAGLPNPTFSQTVGSITTHPQSCQWCHKQYASKAKLLQHQRKKHPDLVQKMPAEEDKQQEEQSDVGQKMDEEITLDAACFNGSFKQSEEGLISEIIELSGDKDGSYYHLVSVAAGDNNFTQPVIGSSDSRLYRLLTTTNGLVPPR